jgi:hypothetical protein
MNDNSKIGPEVSRRGFLKGAAIAGVSAMIPAEKIPTAVETSNESTLGSFQAQKRPLGKNRSALSDSTDTSHPAINLEMLNRGYAFDVVQMPLNPLDPGFRSFESNVLPVANRRGVGVLGMKSMGGSGELISNGAFTPSEALSYAMSLPVATTISGIDSMEVLDQNLAIVRDFKPLSAGQMQKLRDHGQQFNDGRYELYKSTLKYDSGLGRGQHGYPTAAELPL